MPSSKRSTATATTDGTAGSDGGSVDPSVRTIRWMVWVSIACAVAPIVVAVVRAITGDWLPTGDNAYFVIRSRDVLTEHHPLIGAWSSGSQSIDTNVNNLGPLQLDLFAPFTKLAPAAGAAVVVGLTHVLSIAGIAVTVRRLAGDLAAVVAMTVCAGLGWLMGSASLVEARQHPYLMFVLLWYLCLIWALVAGRAWALPWVAFVGSLIVQTQFAFGFIAGLMTVFAAVVFIVATRRTRQSAEVFRRPLIVTVVVLVVVWIQPVIDQFFGDGNIGRVISTPGMGDKPTVGEAVQLVASIVTSPSHWLRPSFARFDPNRELTSLPLSLLGLAMLCCLLIATWRLAGRRHDEGIRAGVVTSAALMVGALLVAKSQPVSLFGFTLDNFRWLWPALAFVLIVIVAEMVTSVTSGARLSRASVSTAAVATLSALAIAVANLPYSAQNVDDPDTVAPDASVRDLLGQLDADVLPETVLFDRTRGYFGEPYSYPVLLRLEQLGIGFTFAPTGGHETMDVFRFGTSRRDDGQAAEQLSLVMGPPAREQSQGARRIAYVSGLDDAQRDELDSLGDTVTDALRAGTIDVDLDGAAAGNEFFAAIVEAAIDGTDAPPATTLSEALRVLRREGFVAVDESVADDFERFATLGKRDQVNTVGLFLHPVGTDL